MQKTDWEKRSAAYWEKAKLFVKNGTTDPQNPPWFRLRLGAESLPAWVDYFRVTLRGLPAGLTLLEHRKVDEFLVPCERPEWFDPEFMPSKYIADWPSRESAEEPTERQKARVAELAASVRFAANPDDDRARRRREQSARRQEREQQAFGIKPAAPGQIAVSDSLRAKLAEHQQYEGDAA